ncbi:H-2 class I histocompatibility antigen, TLA(B) alpha chain-like [Peromyscus maniculatus bairdii]|uniref:H-2 class I histocompatibility antigen, TLA(B) alpha chain-like n=1 Tax=Peromyscus maniculatus bairdii TaxID=230844 RepID=UPI003FD59AD6
MEPSRKPPQSIPIMTIVCAVLGAVVILGFIIGGVMLWMRKNTGGEGGYAPAAGRDSAYSSDLYMEALKNSCPVGLRD